MVFTDSQKLCHLTLEVFRAGSNTLIHREHESAIVIFEDNAFDGEREVFRGMECQQ
jgi:hypothetical protein